MTTQITPISPADYYTKHWSNVSERALLFMHGGPATRKGGEHAPVSDLNTGDGVRTVIGCMCGARPKNPPQSSRSNDAAYRAHIRTLGLPAIRNFHHAVYATGKGYPAEGLTWDEWYAIHPGKDPFGQRD